MKRPALQNKRIGVSRMAFQARKVFETFEKRAPGPLHSKGKIRVFLLQEVLFVLIVYSVGVS